MSSSIFVPSATIAKFISCLCLFKAHRLESKFRVDFGDNVNNLPKFTDSRQVQIFLAKLEDLPKIKDQIQGPVRTFYTSTVMLNIMLEK